MSASVSTAISDGALAIAALGGAVWITRRRHGPAIHASSSVALGLALIAAAALIGSLRFAGVDQLTELHALLTAIAKFAARPLIGLGHLALAWRLRPSARAVTLVLLALTTAPLLAYRLDLADIYGLAIGTAGVLGVFAAAGRQRSRHPRAATSAAAGGALVLIAGLVIGTRGMIGPVLRVDAFHYAMALAAILLARLPRP
jgi:hypothetical protein